MYTLISSPTGELIDSLALDHIAAHEGAAFGRLRVWGALGWATVALGVGRLLSAWETRPAFVFGAAGVLLAAALAWRGLPAAGGQRASMRSWRGADGGW